MDSVYLSIDVMAFLVLQPDLMRQIREPQLNYASVETGCYWSFRGDRP